MIHTLLYLLAFLVAFCLLVTVHEFGHFWVARRLGFKVLRFSIGFGKPLWKWVHPEGHEYWISSLPIGGYVKMLDEREGPVAAHELHRSFTRRPHWQRILVLLAGPGFNVLFAVLVLTGVLYANGMTQYRAVVGTISPTSLVGKAGLKSGDEITSIDGQRVTDQRDVDLDMLDAISGGGPISIGVRSPDGTARTLQLRITNPAERLRLTEPTLMEQGLGLTLYTPPLQAIVDRVLAGGPAAKAGLAPGDRIVSVNGQSVTDLTALKAALQSHVNQSISLRFVRAGHEQGVRLVPKPQTDEQGHHSVGIGILVSQTAPFPSSMVRHVALSVPAAFARANVEAWDVTALQGRMIWRMLTNHVSVKNLSGPLSIAEYAGDAASEGFTSFLQFLVLLSLALGFMNLLPIPILDGGQIVFQTIEWLKGSPLSERFQLVSQQIGFALLFLLMGVALFNDISQIG
ncbi:MAG TPA: RIP metalloprotease RseP [Steroidobacteraceae bacterium]|nr:RIP metalloprotease RseP [Steroidobacteraceae bacterium]